ncbi:MAG: hypothetical protein R2825_15375 [Saprospiraceae bacterium]
MLPNSVRESFPLLEREFRECDQTRSVYFIVFKKTPGISKSFPAK